jgi:hypothetical protein
MRSYEDKRKIGILSDFSSSRMSQWFQVLAGGIYGMYVYAWDSTYDFHGTIKSRTPKTPVFLLVCP